MANHDALYFTFLMRISSLDFGVSLWGKAKNDNEMFRVSFFVTYLFWVKQKKVDLIIACTLKVQQHDASISRNFNQGQKCFYISFFWFQETDSFASTLCFMSTYNRTRKILAIKEQLRKGNIKQRFISELIGSSTSFGRTWKPTKISATY